MTEPMSGEWGNESAKPIDPTVESMYPSGYKEKSQGEILQEELETTAQQQERFDEGVQELQESGKDNKFFRSRLAHGTGHEGHNADLTRHETDPDSPENLPN